MLKIGNIRGIPEAVRFIKTVPYGAVKVALPAIAEYLIGNMQHGLAHYSPYRYVNRKRAYGKPFESDKQRRWFFGALNRGEILPGYPRRTGNTQRGYYQKPTNNGYGVTIANDQTGAYYTRDPKGQARLNALAGWLKAPAVIANNIAGAIRRGQAKVNEWLRKQ